MESSIETDEGSRRSVIQKRPRVQRVSGYVNGKIGTAKDASGKVFRSLRHRNYRLFFSGQLVSLCGTWMQNVAQSWLVWELSHSAVWLGIIGFMTFLPQLFFSLFGGTAADRFPRRGLIIVTQTVSMTLAFVLAALVWTNAVTVWWVAVLAF
ncbi:MAG TPA: MFS transporter, partial [Candidatus Kapabacteria bacterium]|nr:MFS transporter [Candidatus Kapabacteria bacterium]